MKRLAPLCVSNSLVVSADNALVLRSVLGLQCERYARRCQHTHTQCLERGDLLINKLALLLSVIYTFGAVNNKLRYELVTTCTV